MHTGSFVLNSFHIDQIMVCRGYKYFILHISLLISLINLFEISQLSPSTQIPSWFNVKIRIANQNKTVSKKNYGKVGYISNHKTK
jgi:hypothetical protein